MAMRNMNRDNHKEAPLSVEEMRRRPGLDATTRTVPEELRRLEDPSAPMRKVQRVDRMTADQRANEPLILAGHKPDWVASSFKPRRIREAPPPIVKHRGEHLEPMIIWGDEDRKKYNDTSYPWGCVCKITNTFGKSGSGVLIGPRHVLTASHNVAWSSDAAEKIQVHLVGLTASATAFCTIAYAFTQIEGDPTVTTLDEDYAVLVLDARLGDRFGWMGTKQYSSDWDGDNVWCSIGYSGDTGFRDPLFQIGKSMDEDEWDLGSGRAMTTAADMNKGQSGSPMFGFWDNVPYVVAVMSAYGNVWASGNENWCSGGSDLNRIVRIARDENP